MKSYVPKQKRASNPVGNPITFRKSPWVGLRYDRGKVAEFVVTVVRHLCGNLLIFGNFEIRWVRSVARFWVRRWIRMRKVNFGDGCGLFVDGEILWFRQNV